MKIIPLLRLALAATIFTFPHLWQAQAMPSSDTDWRSVGVLPGVNGQVTAMLRADGVLYVAGSFTVLGDVEAKGIAKWDGTTWTSLGSGLASSRGKPQIYALAVDGLGNLYAGGDFTSAGGVAASNIAKWDGAVWSALGTGTNNTVWALATDAGNRVYAGGDFTTAGGVAVYRVASWSEGEWSALGSGMSSRVACLAVDESGRLHAGGSFTTAGGVTVNRLARWSGSEWSPLGSGFDGQVQTMVFDGTGNLFVGGLFTSVDGVTASGIAQWDGFFWSSLGYGLGGVSSVNSLALDESGALHVGGMFRTAGGLTVNHLAKWNGATWSALGSGIDDPYRSLLPSYAGALAFGPDGGLYVGGTFAGGTVSGVDVFGLARWKDDHWTAPEFESGFWGRLHSVTVGAAGQIYAVGKFRRVGPVAASNIAEWTGSEWNPLGSGLTYPSAFGSWANAMVADGDGNLYAGGLFSMAGEVSASLVLD